MTSLAEQQAEVASKRPAFAINLPDLRATVTEILSQFGKFGFFETYTKHNITHIDEMLRSLDWIIPPTNRNALTPADWFLIVCGIFLHDIGLLITRDEFSRRGQTGFQQFVTTRLFSGDAGKDYQERLKDMPDDERDRFLYEEFVREHHGRRARSWIEGKLDVELGVAEEALTLLNRVLAPLDPMVRNDIGILVESHNLDDLKDLKKYPVTKPYANEPQDVANLQYCAVVIRTADLLQITKDRAPTTLFQLISPKNPVSQVEWIKQGAVRMVRPMPARNSDNNADPALLPDSIEVFATFSDQRGFFGLGSLLEYAERQIRTSHDLVQASKTRDAKEHEFPWKRIERGSIDADGFIKQPFRFEIDQSKILDLLTGHTLYNDSLVVTRELVQNGLDAVRLFELQQTNIVTQPNWTAQISIFWNPGERLLQVTDNGTGMSQATIENHLLKVGSSKYQESQFKKDYAGFSPISRFGIGILSAFMIADEVEILTTEETDNVVRAISLESVHGDYLIKHLDKKDDARARELGQSGTRVSLKVRPSAKTQNLLAALRNWILIPRCTVIFQEVDKEPLVIGYNSPSEAVAAILANAGLSGKEATGAVRVVQHQKDGLEIAYAQRWSETYREWSLLACSAVNSPRSLGVPTQPACTCVNGIAVEFTTPGFRGPQIVAVSDATGARAPKTNVARTALEENDDSELLCTFTYETLVNSVKSEIARLQDSERYTLTRATNEAVYLTLLLSQDTNPMARYQETLRAKVNSLPYFLIEGNKGEARTPFNLYEMNALSEFWTVEGDIIRSAEGLLGQFSSNVTLQSTIHTLSDGKFTLPSPLLCNFSSLGRFQALLFEKFQVAEIAMEAELKQLRFRWERLGEVPNWVDLTTIVERQKAIDPRIQKAASDMLQAQVLNRFGLRAPTSRFLVGRERVQINGLDSFGAVNAYRTIFLRPSERVAEFLIKFADNEGTNSASLGIYITILGALIKASNFRSDADAVRQLIGECLGVITLHFKALDMSAAPEFEAATCGSNLTAYEPFIWSARSNALYES